MGQSNYGNLWKKKVPDKHTGGNKHTPRLCLTLPQLLTASFESAQDVMFNMHSCTEIATRSVVALARNRPGTDRWEAAPICSFGIFHHPILIADEYTDDSEAFDGDGELRGRTGMTRIPFLRCGAQQDLR